MMHRYKIALMVLCVGLLFCIPAHAQDITTGLIGHWTLDETSGTTIIDSSVTGADGTWTGSADVNSVPGPRGNAQNFDNVGEYIDMGDINAMDGLTQMTVAVWVKSRIAGANAAESQVVDKSQCNGVFGSGPWEILVSGWTAGRANFLFYPSDGTPSNFLNSGDGTSNVDDGDWHFLVGRYDGNNIEIWVDGVLESSASYPGETMTSTGNRVMVGGYCEAYNLSYIWDGDIDDVRVYNRALDTADILYLYDYTKPGKIRYNANWRVPEYLAAGTHWVAMGPQRYAPHGISFYESYNAINARLSRTTNITGVSADSKLVTGSFWFRRSVVSQGSQQIIWASNNGATASDANSRFRIELAADNTLRIVGKFDGTTTVLDVRTTSAFTDPDWHHVMFSFDMANASNRYIYVDGASNMAAPATYTDNTIDFVMATPRNSVGARHGGTTPFFGELADFWFDIGRYTDLSDAQIRGKFYNGGPVYLGPTGALPLGTAPDVYLTVEDNSDSFQDNEGTGGAFTLTNNLTDSFSRPGVTPNAIVGSYTVHPGSISTGQAHSCGIRTDGIGMCWGYVISWGTGHGSATQFNVPEALYGNARWKQISSGYSTSCGIQDNDEAFCWGVNTIYHASVGESGPWRMIDTVGSTVCAVKEDNTGWCTGLNANGQLGDGTTTDTSAPLQLPGQWLEIKSGWQHTCGIKTDGTAWCWGRRDEGALGDGGSLVGNQTTPVQVSDAGPWQQISAGGGHSCGIKTDGTAWCWGWREYGRLGDGGATTASAENTPVQVSDPGPWTFVDAGGGEHTCGIKSDGTGWCWGLDNEGQLGDSAGDDTSNVPLAISGADLWSSISAGERHTCGIRSDNVGRCWGHDGTEQRLGNGAGNTDQFTPVTISGSHAWAFAPTTGCLNPDRKESMIVYNGDEDVPQFCNGEDWIAMGPVPGPGGGGCSNPSRNTGTILYASDHRLMQYCDGSDWIQIGHRTIAPTDGLIGHWTLDETSGTTANDSTANNNDGTMQNMTGAANTVPGQDETALNFDGSAEYINIGNPALFQITGSMTIAAWVKMETNAEIKHIVSKQGSTPDYGWRLATAGSNDNFVMGVTSDGVAMTDRESVVLPVMGTWYHVVGVYNATAQTLDIYINGVLNNGTLTGTVPASQFNSAQNVNIGRRLTAPNRYFDGDIDDVRIYDRPLSASEISDLYYATGGN
jgi:alpha-tubulin suppressor-like RCC1 family protein